METEGTELRREAAVVWRKWTLDEIKDFLNAIERHGVGRWSRIGEDLNMPGFSADNYRKRWYTLLDYSKKSRKKRYFLPDTLWSQIWRIADSIPAKVHVTSTPPRNQGKHRNLSKKGNSRDSDSNSSEWSLKRINKFLDALETCGVGNWAEIRDHLGSPSYTSDKIRNRWNALARASKRRHSTRFNLPDKVWNRIKMLQSDEDVEEIDSFNLEKESKQRWESLLELTEEEEMLEKALEEHPAYDQDKKYLTPRMSSILGIRLGYLEKDMLNRKVIDLMSIESSKLRSSHTSYRGIASVTELTFLSFTAEAVEQMLLSFADAVDGVLQNIRKNLPTPVLGSDLLEESVQGIPCAAWARPFLRKDRSVGICTTCSVPSFSFLGIFVGTMYSEKQYRRNRANAPFVTGDLDAEYRLVENSRRCDWCPDDDYYCCVNASGTFGNEKLGNLTCLVQDGKNPNAALVDVVLADAWCVPVMFLIDSVQAGEEIICSRGGNYSIDLEDAARRQQVLKLFGNNKL